MICLRVIVRSYFQNSCFVFRRGIQTPRNNKSTRPAASCFHLFLGVWIPRWNTRSRFGNSTSYCSAFCPEPLPMALYHLWWSLGSSLNLYIPLPIQPPNKHRATHVVPSQCRKAKPIKPMHPITPIPIKEPGSKGDTRLWKCSKAIKVNHAKMTMYTTPIMKSGRLWNILSMLRLFCNIKWKMWNTGVSGTILK